MGRVRDARKGWPLVLARSCLCRVQKSIEQKLNDWGASRGRLIVHSNNNRNCVTRRAPGGRRRTKERGKGRNKDNGLAVERAGVGESHGRAKKYRCASIYCADRCKI